MMGLNDFGLSILASWLANKIVIRKPESSAESVQTRTGAATDLEMPEDDQATRPAQIFKTFDAWHDLESLLEVVKGPVISVLIEDRPSTHYQLASLVLESKFTREWYVFSRGRMSFQGTGGGIANSKQILSQLRSQNVPIGVWVLSQELLDRLDGGLETWPSVQKQAIPFLAAASSNYGWEEIRQNVSALTADNSVNKPPQ